jgi:hypothetical protein
MVEVRRISRDVAAELFGFIVVLNTVGRLDSRHHRQPIDLIQLSQCFSNDTSSHLKAKIYYLKHELKINNHMTYFL